MTKEGNYKRPIAVHQTQHKILKAGQNISNKKSGDFEDALEVYM